jgi:hypothetical protein
MLTAFVLMIENKRGGASSGRENTINKHRTQGRTWMRQLLFNIQGYAHLLETRYNACVAQMEGSNQGSNLN